ncbi:MAG: hypothetical protein KC609_08510 [Myxococcales bacterium]|nr:hypothetical protein [Myxococcales bacterium]
MRRSLTTVASIGLSLVALTLVTGCNHHPLDDFRGWLERSEAGDVAAFRAGFTKRSRLFIDGVFTLSKAHPLLRFPKRFTGKTQIVTPRDQVRIRGDRAEFDVLSAGERVHIVMLREGRHWRIDLFQRANRISPLGER